MKETIIRRLQNDNSNSMYLFTLIFIIQRFHYHLSDREHMSQPIIVKQMTYANSVPVPTEVKKLNQKFHPEQREGFQQGRTYALC